MAKENKARRFRLTLVNDNTHKHLWMLHFQRSGLLLTVLSVILVFLLAAFCMIAFTPLKTFIPGYPDATVQRAAIRSAMTVDSLEHVVDRWEFYAESLRRIVEGEDPVQIDSLVRAQAAQPMDQAEKARLSAQDSLLRQQVMEAERFGLDSRTRKLPIEGMHFFPPLKGVISQAFDPTLHPAVDITAPANSVVMAVLDGTVIYAGWSDEAGYSLAIQHDNDLISLYKHNQRLIRSSGEKVTAGTPVAIVGNTGTLTTGDHLHFELWYKGEAVDPAKYIGF
ncbi:MAG: M23 family metallopeptidase [Bacteroidales bacterium]|nr:M23 family metallopeptidase [Bacteroidales bacterium]